MTQSERQWLVTASCVLLLAIILVQLLLNIPGRDIPFYAAIAAGAVLLSLRSSRAVRIWSVAATLLSLTLLFVDFREGVRFQRVMLDSRDKIIADSKLADPGLSTDARRVAPRAE